MWQYMATGVMLILTVILSYVSGQNKQKADQLKNDGDASKERIKKDTEIEKTSDADLDKRLSKWVRE